MNKLLQIAINAATTGGQRARTYFEKNLQIELKKDHTPVTIADKETEALIKQTILQSIPDAQFVGEEYGGDWNKNSYWLIDPIDGTICFIRKIPLWGTLISYIENGEATIAVSYIPMQNELLYAENGKGAFNNGKPIHVSRIANIEDAFFTHAAINKVVDKLPGFLELSKNAFKVRGIGDSFGYHLLAQGKIEGVFDGGLSPWDLAGVKLIVEEAGGKVTNFKGEPWTFKDDNAIATNGLIHQRVLEEVHHG